jgi:hypothetical protein
LFLNKLKALIEKLIVVQSVKKSFAFIEPEDTLLSSKQYVPGPKLSDMNPAHTLTSYFFFKSSLISYLLLLGLSVCCVPVQRSASGLRQGIK